MNWNEKWRINEISAKIRLHAAAVYDEETEIDGRPFVPKDKVDYLVKAFADFLAFCSSGGE